jgi:hypothetical protein
MSYNLHQGSPRAKYKNSAQKGVLPILVNEGIAVGAFCGLTSFGL